MHVGTYIDRSQKVDARAAKFVQRSQTMHCYEKSRQWSSPMLASSPGSSPHDELLRVMTFEHA